MGYGLITKLPPSANQGGGNANPNNFSCNPGLMGNMNSAGAAVAPGFNFMQPPNGGNMNNNSGLIGNSNTNHNGRDHLLNGGNSSNGFGGSASSLNGGTNNSMLPMFGNGNSYGNGGGGAVNNGKLKSFF